MAEQAGRYNRSMAGMVGALIVTLVIIGGFVVFRAVNRDDLEIEPEKVDYLSSVEFAQEAGESPAYPAELPEGWVATSVEYLPGDRPEWGIGLLTDDRAFVGVRQQDASVASLVDEYVDSDADEGDPVPLDSAIAKQWQTFSDSGGDYAVATEVGEESLIVFGTAGEQEVRDFAASLVTDPA